MLWILIVSSVMRQPPSHRETSSSSSSQAVPDNQLGRIIGGCHVLVSSSEITSSPHLGTLSSAQVSPYPEWAVMVPANTYTTLTTDQCTCLNWPR